MGKEKTHKPRQKQGFAANKRFWPHGLATPGGPFGVRAQKSSSPVSVFFFVAFTGFLADGGDAVQFLFFHPPFGWGKKHAGLGAGAQGRGGGPG